MGFWHAMKVKLGLEEEWDDEEYYEDDYHDAADDDDAASPYSSAAGVGAVRRLERGEPDRHRASHLRSVPAVSERGAGIAPQVKMHIVEPKSFGEAQAIADRFKQGTPVILNLTSAPPDVAKRLLDFTAGLTYGLDGGLQKVSERVFMLTPANVEVSEADRRRLQSTGMFTIPE